MSQRLDFFATMPQGMKTLFATGQYVAASLPAGLIHLVNLRISQINGCAFCLDMHTKEALRDGDSIERLALLPAWHEVDGVFTDRERAALQWAESLTLIATTRAPDADFAAAKAQFNDKELADLTLAIGLMNTYNRLSIGFRNPPEAAKLKRAG